MTPTKPPWLRVKALFEQALDLPEPEREAFVASADCDTATRAEVRSLLLHHGVSDSGGSSGVPGFMDGSAPRALALSLPGDAADSVAAQAARVGQRLGAWEVVRPIGSGGMGDVVEAKRADGQYEGRAAIKLLKRGMDSAAVLQRFAQERQALARLSHPHIARLLDAGASPDGQPYFVLEFVDGRPIDVAAAGLTVEARLRLFLQLADAVAHAHRNLLVHRDLKPGNVLVDSEGQVKLLDFGIAKALDPTEHANGDTTVAGQRPYTPHYASPEQVRGEPVTTATDIYSLGVLLYQLLTGTRPTGRKASTPQEAARSVLEDAPTRPSRLTSLDTPDPQWLQTRKKLEGDLDNILLKALEKDVVRRYTSVDALAADIQHCLAGRPVSARPASPAYVLGRFVRRNRWAVLAGSLGGLGLATGLAAALLQERQAAVLGVLGLAGGLGVALFKGRQAELARASAEQHVADLRRLSRDVVVEYGDAITYVPGGMARKAAMLSTTLGYLDRLAGAAGNDPAFQGEIGSVYARLADLQTTDNYNASEDPEAAVRNARRAVELLKMAGNSNDASAVRWWARALCVLGKAAQHRNALDAALLRLAEADAVLLAGLQRFAGDLRLIGERAAALMLTVSVHYGYNKCNRNQPEAALAVLREAHALYLQLTRGPGAVQMDDVFQLGGVAANQALILARQERWPEAIVAARDALLQRQRASQLEPHNRVVLGAVAADRNLLGALCLTAGDVSGALAEGRAAWAALQRLMAEDADNQAWPLQHRYLALNLGRALLAAGDVAAALPVLQVSADWLAPVVAAGTATPMQRRRLAQTQLAQACALHASGAPLEAVPLATAAAQSLQALVAQGAEPAAEPSADRDSWMALGECAATLSAWHSDSSAQHWKDQAHRAYAQAGRMQPLTAEHARRAAWAGC